MTVLNQLATALQRRDEEPNIELAQQIAAKNDAAAIKELADNLANKSKDIQNDCIKVLYEAGAIKPALLKPHIKQFVALLQSKNNRMQWGAMTALSAVVPADPKAIYAALPAILDAADKGSVITKDHAVHILVKLSAEKTYATEAFTLLVAQLQNALPNQLPMYAELALPLVNEKNKASFIKALRSRLDEMEKESKRKRLEKVIRKAGG